ncbi:MAG: hypothetical protein IJK01_07135 [Clostridia bacterium]|nr:hypothetical protein [Clostridia bacterium]
MSELTALLEDRPLLTTGLMDRVRDYFQEEDHRKQFELWYKKKYGKEYEWRKEKP